MNTRVDKHIDHVQDENEDAKQISKNDYNLNYDHQVANRHALTPIVGQRFNIQQADARPVKYAFEGHGQLPEADQAGGETSDDIRQGGPQDILPLEGFMIQPFGARQLNIIFLRINDEECAPGIDQLEQEAQDQRADRQKQVPANGQHMFNRSSRSAEYVEHPTDWQPA